MGNFAIFSWFIFNKISFVFKLCKLGLPKSSSLLKENDPVQFFLHGIQVGPRRGISELPHWLGLQGLDWSSNLSVWSQSLLGREKINQSCSDFCDGKSRPSRENLGLLEVLDTDCEYVHVFQIVNTSSSVPDLFTEGVTVKVLRTQICVHVSVTNFI